MYAWHKVVRFVYCWGDGPCWFSFFSFLTEMFNDFGILTLA